MRLKLRAGHGCLLLAFVWGWSEATWFFVVPDVCLTFIALYRFRVAALAIVTALAGAMMGAATLYGLHGAGWDLMPWWQFTPGYEPRMFEVAGAQLLQEGPEGLTDGPIAEIPYRFYVWIEAQRSVALGSVLAWTPAARLERFVIFPCLSAGLLALHRRWRPRAGVKPHAAGWALLWIAIYLHYWFVTVPTVYG